MEILQLSVFVLLIVGGQVALPLLLVTLALSRSVIHRTATSTNFLVCVVAYSTSLLLLFYAGETDSPPFVLCRLQSALVNASGPLLSVAGVALICETLSHVSMLENPQVAKPSRLKTALLVGVPWLIFAAFFAAFFASGLRISQHEQSAAVVQPLIYCRFPPSVLRSVGYVFEMGGLAVILATEVFIVIRLSQYKENLKAKGVVLPVSLVHSALRGLLFTVYALVTMCAIFLFYNDTYTGSAYIAISLIPLVAFLIFGTQRDVLRVWFRCYPWGHGGEPPLLDVEAQRTMSQYMSFRRSGIKSQGEIVEGKDGVTRVDGTFNAPPERRQTLSIR